MSILLFLLRLTGQKQVVKKAIWTLLILNGLVTCINIFFVIFQCLPIAAVWNPTAHPNAKCINFGKTTTAFASIAVITDSFVLILPTWIVYDLHIHKPQKLMLIGILSFGLMYVPSISITFKYEADSLTPCFPQYRHLGPCPSRSPRSLQRLQTHRLHLHHPLHHLDHRNWTRIHGGLRTFMKPLVFKFAPRIFSMTRYGRTTNRPTRGDYELSGKSWKEIERRKQTKIQSNGNFDFKAGMKVIAQEEGSRRSENEIVMVRDTEIKWQGLDEPSPSVKNQASTESLV